MSIQRFIGVMAAALLAASAGQAHAAGTRAGTVINNQAVVRYSIGPIAMDPLNSNVATLTVAERIEAGVTWQDAGPVSVAPGQTGAVTTFRVSNTGNGDESYFLSAIGAGLGGDQFDPDVTAVYLDANGNSAYDGGDTLYSPASPPTLAPDGSVIVFVLSTIPGTGLSDGDTGNVRLTATSTTGTGAPGTVFAGKGDGGVDAVIGLSGGTAEAIGTYRASVGSVVEYLLTVVKQGTGSGVVTASTGTISWSGNTGTETYASGTAVTLTAAANADSDFAGWTGCDSVSGNQCLATMTTDKNVTATFTLRPPDEYLLTVVKEGTGSGIVTSGTGTLSWSGNTGTETYTSGTAVTLTATADGGSDFSGWTGCDSVNGNECAVLMTSDKNVTATFTLRPAGQYLLTVVKEGTGSGDAASDAGTLAWSGNTGTQYLASGTVATLTATANAGSDFAGWTGCDSVSGAVCTVTMTSDRTVLATFSLRLIISIKAEPYRSARFLYPLGDAAPLTKIPGSYQKCSFTVENNTTDSYVVREVPILLPADVEFCHYDGATMAINPLLPAGLTYNGAAFARSGGSAYDFSPAFDPATHCNAEVTAVKTALDGTMPGNSSFTIELIVRVK